jgi:hypothetical protein
MLEYAAHALELNSFVFDEMWLKFVGWRGYQTLRISPSAAKPFWPEHIGTIDGRELRRAKSEPSQ